MNIYQRGLVQIIVDAGWIDSRRIVARDAVGNRYLATDMFFQRHTVKADLAIEAIDIQLNVNYN